MVAVEANPLLVAAMERRFANAIAEGRLSIVGAAISEESDTARLSVCDDIAAWTSVDADFVARATRQGARYHTVEVPALRFETLLAEHGIPHYLKIDIEGHDMLCVKALREVDQRPDFLSIESAVTSPGGGFHSVSGELAELWRLGYRRFKYVDQSRLPAAFPAHSSGPFGEATRGDWSSVGPALAQGAALRLHYDLGAEPGRLGATVTGRGVQKLRHVLRRPLGWYDLHAKLGPRDR